MGLKAIVLAAGKGTRMKSDMLKVLHDVAGKPILAHVLDTISALDVDDIFLVVGHQSELVRQQVKHPRITFIDQMEQLGTGHAVMQVEPQLMLSPQDTVVVLAGDCPLIEPDTLRQMLAIHCESNAAGTVLTTHMAEPGSYGRILRGKMGTVMGIKEAKDCTATELKLTEINTGVYAFEVEALFSSLKKVGTNNAQQEYYLTDVIKLIKSSGGAISAFCTDDPDQVVGINTRMDLAKINSIIYQRNNLFFMENGVTIIDPFTTFIDSTVQIGLDSIISPFTVLQGSTVVGARCRIGSHSFFSGAFLADDTHVPPFTHINGPQA